MTLDRFAGSVVRAIAADCSRLNGLPKQILMAAKLTDGKVAEDIAQLLRQSLDALTQTLSRGQPLQAKSLGEERLVAVFSDGIKVGFAHGDQSNHRMDDVYIRNPVFSPRLRTDGRQMVLEFLFSQLIANNSHPDRGGDGSRGKLKFEIQKTDQLDSGFTGWVKIRN